MTAENEEIGSISRRHASPWRRRRGGMALLGPGGRAAIAQAGPAAPSGKPNSVINGVRIGCITYSYRDDRASTPPRRRSRRCSTDGLSEIELMDGPIRSYAGISGGRGRGRAGRATPRRRRAS